MILYIGTDDMLNSFSLYWGMPSHWIHYLPTQAVGCAAEQVLRIRQSKIPKAPYHIA
jgi:hypothetical protein